ncbi:MAG: autotransporter outer membrane beta-barrel domain-containing protein, partial [Alphaproteobacteria bacterium]|nr:autotransporter outer membrane beta-barrel domain-containing protein [Alphaproteobacteria bacterium]
TEWTAGGLAVGYERRSTLGGGDLTAGLSVGYSAATAKTPDRLASSDAQGAYAGVYGEWTDDTAWLSGSVSYGANHVTSSRDIVIGALTRTASANYWMQGVDTALKASYGYELSDGLKVGPMAGLATGWSGHGGFSETGAGSLNATVGASSTWRVESALGASFAYKLQGQADEFKVSGRALWLHNFGDNSTSSTITLAGGGAPFTVVSPASGRDRLELGAGFAWSPSDAIKLSLDYTGRFYGGQTDHVAKAGLALDF